MFYLSFPKSSPPGEAWGNQTAAASNTNSRRASNGGNQPRSTAPVLLQPLAHSPTASAGSSPFATNDGAGPLLPNLPLTPQPPPAHSSPATRKATLGGKKTVPVIAALAHTPRDSATYKSINQLYQVYNIGGFPPPGPYGTKRGKGGKKQQRNQLGDTTGLSTTADASSSPYYGGKHRQQLPPGSFPYGPLHSNGGQPTHPTAFNSTLSEGTSLPIPSNEEAYNASLYQQQQQSQYPLQPQPPASQPSKANNNSVRFRGVSHSSSKASLHDADEKVNHNEQQQQQQQQQVKKQPLTISNGKPSSSTSSSVVDDSNDVVVVYDHGQDLSVSDSVLGDPSSNAASKPPPSYSVQPSPGYTAAGLGHLMGSSTGEELSGSGGSAPLEIQISGDAKEQTGVIETTRIVTSDSTSGSAAADILTLDSSSSDAESHSVGGNGGSGSWKDSLFAFLNNEEHQRRLFRWNLQENFIQMRQQRQQQQQQHQLQGVHRKKNGANLLGGDEDESHLLSSAAGHDDPSSIDVVVLRKSDMEIFSATKLDSLVYFRSFESDGRHFSSLLELSRATEFAHKEWIKRKNKAYSGTSGTKGGKGSAEFDDMSLTRLLTLLKSPQIHIFDLAESVNVTKRDLYALLVETSLPPAFSAHLTLTERSTAACDRAVSLITLFEQQGRKFWSFSQFLHALIVEEMRLADFQRIRQEILQYLTSSACKLFQKPTNTYTATGVLSSTTSTASGNQTGNGPTYLITEADVNELCSNSSNQPALSPLDCLDSSSSPQGSIGIPELLCPYLIQMLEQRNKFAGYTFKDFFRLMHEEKRRIATQLSNLVKRKDENAASSSDESAVALLLPPGSSTVSSSPLSSWGEMPGSILMDEDLIRLFVESGVGLDLIRYFRLLEQEKNIHEEEEEEEKKKKNKTAATTEGESLIFNPLSSPPPFPTVTDLITRLRALHSHWVSRRRAVLDYLSSSRCYLFSQSTRDILVGMNDVDRLLTEGGAEPHTVRYLEVFDAAQRHFSSFEDLLTSVKQTTALVAERQKAAKVLLRENLADPSRTVLIQPLSPASDPLTDSQLDHLLDAGGSTSSSVLHHLSFFHNRGQRNFHNLSELITAVAFNQTRALECKRAIWSHLHSTNSRILGPLAKERKIAIEAAAREVIEEKKRKEKEEYLRGGGLGSRKHKASRSSLASPPVASSSSASNVSPADQATVAAAAADSILSEADVSNTSSAQYEAKDVAKTAPTAESAALAKEKNELEADPLLSVTHSTAGPGDAAPSPSVPAPHPTAALPPPILSTQEVDALYSTLR